MSYFEPQPEFANELELLLMTAASGGDNTNRQQALSTIEGYKSNPDFFRYCAFILSNPNPVSGVDATFVRQLAAFQIKNGLRHPNCRGLLEVRQLTIAALGDQNRRVRKAAGGILATAVMHGIWNARSVMGELVDGLNQGDESLPGYLAAIAEVVEENIEPLDVESDSGAALTPTIAAFILPYLGHENLDVQKDALVIVDVLLEQAALRREGPAFEALRGSVNDLLTYVAGILQNPEAPPKFVGLAIQCLYYTLAYADSVAHLVPNMTDMMTGLAAHPSEEVRTEVVMFFAAIVGAEMTGLISDYIPAVLQYLLDSLVFSEMELEMLAATEGDAGEPDRPEDVRPKIFQHGAKRAGGDDDDEDGDMDVDQWNLRVASGQTLDAFARAIGDEVLSHILDPLAQRLNNGNDWRTQESAVMAVGVLAGTCQGLNDYLPDIMNTIFTLLESPSHFLVKCMCCWALEQNAEWLMTSDASLSNGYLGRAITNICQCMQSNTKILQTRATSALGGFAATAEGEELHPFAVEIVETLANCFANYQLKNVYILFENVDAVYKCFGRRLAEEDVITTVMTPLQNLWATLGNESPVIFPFFMALGSAASAIGSAIEPMATEIFTRGVGLAEHHQLARQYAAQADEDMPDFSTEFLIAALDLLSGLANALGSGITPYLQELGETRTMQLIMTAAADPIADVRQSAFGLMGELCSGCIGFMQGNWGVFAPLILNGISDLDELEVASNAAWTLGEFLANYLDGQGYPAFEQQHSDGFMSRLASLLALEFNADLRNLWENVAIAIGRLLTYDPDAAYRTQLEAWQPGWALSMSNMPNCPQKEAALRGVLNVWMNDPAVVTTCLKAFLDTMTSLPNNMPNDLKTQLTAFIELVKQGYGQDQWGQIMSQYTPQMRDKLRRMYRVQ